MRTVTVILYACTTTIALLFAANTAEAQDRLIERIDVTSEIGLTHINFNFNVPLLYVTHAPKRRSDVVEITFQFTGPLLGLSLVKRAYTGQLGT